MDLRHAGCSGAVIAGRGAAEVNVETRWQTVARWMKEVDAAITPHTLRDLVRCNESFGPGRVMVSEDGRRLLAEWWD